MWQLKPRPGPVLGNMSAAIKLGPLALCRWWPLRKPDGKLPYEILRRKCELAFRVEEKGA